MTARDLPHLELLAEVDALADQLRRWSDAAPPWQPARNAGALVRRLLERVEMLRLRLEAPLVVAMLGGSGTGKSALVNAILGTDVVRTGRQRPTTARPTLVCRPDLTPEMLGIDPAGVDLQQHDLPPLSDLVLVDCPDPDTAEDDDARASNLGRLRQILPHCDVLIVTTTQQKYRSSRVGKELAAAAPGARLVFVQTHADQDEDIRDDWGEVLREHYEVGHVFLVDSVSALADAQAGRPPQDQIAELIELLTRGLSGTAASRIRRANFLDLAEGTLASCSRRLDEALPAVEKLREAIDQQRTRLAAPLAVATRKELQASRRLWENRLVGQIASRWGFSPWSLVLRAYQGLGGLLAGALLARVRTPAQLALWGAMQGTRAVRRRQQEQTARGSATRAVSGCWDPAELRSAAVILDGYAAEAQLDRHAARTESAQAEADQAGTVFAEGVARQLDDLVRQQADRHSGWLTRCWYELLLGAMLGVLLYRLGRNYFWDSWLGPELAGVAPTAEVYGLEFYLSSLFWLLLWCGLLLWAFTRGLRRGLRRQIDRLAESWTGAAPAAGIFAALEEQCDEAQRFGKDLDRLQQHVANLRRDLALPEGRLGRWR